MSKARKLRQKGCTIIRKSCATYNWHGFTLQRGHYFWEDEFSFNVSAGVPGRRPGTLCIYKALKSGIDTDYYKWFKTVIYTSYGDGKLLSDLLSAAGGTHIEFKPDRVRTKPNSIERTFPTYVDRRPTKTARLPKPQTRKNYLDEMLTAERNNQGATWVAAVAWKEN